MLIVTRVQPRIYSIVNRIKVFWYILSDVFFVTESLSKELEQTDPYYVNRFGTKGVISEISCKPLGELKAVLLLSSEVLLRVISDISLRYFTTPTFRRSFSLCLLDIR